MKKIAMITGATSGIGKACAEKLASIGYNLILVGRRQLNLDVIKENLVGEYGIQVHSIPFDISDTKNIKNMMQQLPSDWKNIDVLINNAGTAKNAESFQNSDDSGIDIMMDTNVKGLMHLTKQILPNMIQKNSGYIFNIASIASHLIFKGGAVYCASKYAVLAFSQGLRHDLLGTNLKVTTISPGFVKTEFASVWLNNDKVKADAFYEGMEPLLAEDIVETICYCLNTPSRVNIDEIIISPICESGLEVCSK